MNETNLYVDLSPPNINLQANVHHFYLAVQRHGLTQSQTTDNCDIDGDLGRKRLVRFQWEPD